MHRVHGIFVILAPLFLAACDTPPPAVRDASAYQLALQDCRRIARLASGYNQDFAVIGRPAHFIHETSWEIVDPCMRARGFPAPP